MVQLIKCLLLVGSSVIERGKTILRERQEEYSGKDDKVPIVLAPYSHLICLLIIANPFHLIFNCHQMVFRYTTKLLIGCYINRVPNYWLKN